MAENDSGEKTEEATGKRREEAREKGQIAKSPELTTAAFLFGSTVTLSFAGPPLWRFLLDTMGQGLATAHNAERGGVSVIPWLQTLGFRAIVAMLGFVGAMAVIAITVQAAQAPEVVTPPPVDNAATIRDLLEKANAAAGQRKWDDADKQLEMVLALDPEHAGGRALKAKVNAEKAVETAYGEAVAAQGKNDLPGAWQVLTTKLAGMPPDSVYAPQVSEMKGAIGKTLANKLIDEAKAAFAKKQWQEAINKSEAAQKIVPNVDGASDLITKAKKAKIEEAKKDAAKDPKKDPTTDPNEKSADELYKEARSMHNTDKAAALRLYEQAAAKGHVAAYRQIGSIKISMDTNAAINAYKKYLQLNPSAPDADAIREMITKLGGTP